jgi:hypothetical protein
MVTLKKKPKIDLPGEKNYQKIVKLLNYLVRIKNTKVIIELGISY